MVRGAAANPCSSAAAASVAACARQAEHGGHFVLEILAGSRHEIQKDLDDLKKQFVVQEVVGQVAAWRSESGRGGKYARFAPLWLTSSVAVAEELRGLASRTPEGRSRYVMFDGAEGAARVLRCSRFLAAAVAG